jgi:transcriptional regulator with XRE-family HTH domain
MDDAILDPASLTFHLELKAKRAELGISQYELAAAMGTDRVTVARWEKPPGVKLSCRPRLKMAKRLRDFFADPAVLMTGKMTIELVKRLLAHSLGVDVASIDITVRC